MSSHEFLKKLTGPIVDDDAIVECQTQIKHIEQGHIDLESQLNRISGKIDERLHDLERAQRRTHLLETAIMLALAKMHDPRASISERITNAQFYLEAALGKK